jgi:hypothetical protein
MSHDDGRSVERVRAVARAARDRPAVGPGDRGPAAGAAPVRAMPGWVARFHVLPGAAADHWILCEPRPDPGDTYPSQVVIDAPEGRYLLDQFDPATGACTARESAAGGPIVAGLAYTGRPVLLHIQPRGTGEGPPAHDPPG